MVFKVSLFGAGKDMKNIVHIVESSATGTLSMLALAANSQARSGFKVSVIYSVRSESPSNLSDFFDDSIDMVHVQMSGFGMAASSLKRIRGYISAKKPHAVFMHSSFAGFLGRIATLGLPGKYYYLPHCISFMRQDVSQVKKLAFACLEWIGATKSAVYVACSKSEAKKIREFIPFRECVIVENAVDTSKWLNSASWRSRNRRIITVGQIRMQKDPERFAKIASRVLSSHQNIEFVWVGDGDPGLRSMLEEAGVNVVGWKSPEEVRSLLVSSRYYLSTALWEGMPVSPIEGMLSGCVGVLSDCAGNVDIVIDNETGYLYQTIDECVDKISMLLESDQLSERVASIGKSHCEKSFSQERYLTEINDLVTVEGDNR